MDNIIISEKRKRDMKELWKETFHDSDRYIDIVFENYFSLENTFVRYAENRLIASMLCIPYEFQILTKKGTKKQLRGMYLCGLATRPEWRRKGIMSDLMKEAEEEIKDRGYDLTFLIPADNHLREYYNKKGYNTTSWKNRLKIETIDEGMEHSPEKLHIYTIKDFTKKDNHFINQLADRCREIEHTRRNNTILHSLQDMRAIMAENENSIFLTETTFNPEYPILAKVRCVAFPESSERSDEPLRIAGLYIRVEDAKGPTDLNAETIQNNRRILSTIITLLKRQNRTTLELILPYSRKETEKDDAEPYAMTKILGDNQNIDLNENSKFEISLMLD